MYIVVFGVACAVCVNLCNNYILVVVLRAVNVWFFCVGVDIWVHFSANSKCVQFFWI